MFERFTDSARRVVVLAREEARLIGINYIGTEHLLLGLLGEGSDIAAVVLQEFGLTTDAVRTQVTEIIGEAGAPPGDHIPFTPRAKKVLALSLREALNLGHKHIGTEHILLGLIREGNGVAAEVLRLNEVDLEQVREQVLHETSMRRRRRPGGLPVPGTSSLVARLESIQQSLDRIERRLEAMGAPGQGTLPVPEQAAPSVSGGEVATAGGPPGAEPLSGQESAPVEDQDTGDGPRKAEP